MERDEDEVDDLDENKKKDYTLNDTLDEQNEGESRGQNVHVKEKAKTQEG